MNFQLTLCYYSKVIRMTKICFFGLPIVLCFFFWLHLNKVLNPILTYKIEMSLMIEVVQYKTLSLSFNIATFFLIAYKLFCLQFSSFILIATYKHSVSAPQKKEFQSEILNVKMKGCWKWTLELARICLLVFVCIFFSFSIQIFANC